MKMEHRIIPADRSIVVAADVEASAFEGLVERIGAVNGLDGYKIGFEVGLGLSLAQAVHVIKSSNETAVTIYDHQKAGTDIPDTGKNFARTMKLGQVDAAILFPFTGPVVEADWIEALQDQAVGVIVGAEMTHSKLRQSEGGYITDDAFERIFEHALEHDVRNFVVPGNKPERVAHYRRYFETMLGVGKFALYAPGFIAQGGTITEAGRVAGDNWHAIIGRAVTESVVPGQVIRDYVQQIKNL